MSLEKDISLNTQKQLCHRKMYSQTSLFSAFHLHRIYPSFENQEYFSIHAIFSKSIGKTDFGLSKPQNQGSQSIRLSKFRQVRDRDTVSHTHPNQKISEFPVRAGVSYMHPGASQGLYFFPALTRTKFQTKYRNNVAPQSRLEH